MHLMIGKMVHSRYECCGICQGTWIQILALIFLKCWAWPCLSVTLVLWETKTGGLLGLAVECPNSRFSKRSYLKGIGVIDQTLAHLLWAPHVCP